MEQQQINPVQMDRLSDLPDSIIDRILSFLSMREAAVTAALGKRWRYLWTNVPNLKFSGFVCGCEPMCEDCKKEGRFVDWVNKVLAVRTEPCVDKFEVYIQYSERCPWEIDAWIEYAVNSRVKHLELDLYSDGDPQMLPDTIYSCPSLEYLRISKDGLTMAPQRKLEWNALTELCLECLELSQDVIDEIISGCSVLYKWELYHCFGFKSLEINTRSLQILVVNDGDDGDCTLEPAVQQISAPYLQSLRILLAPDGRLFQLGDIGSLVNVYIQFRTYDDEQEMMNLAKGLLQAINHVKELKLGIHVFEVIAFLEMHGWVFPQSTRRCLEVKFSRYSLLSGIIPLLESSPDLEMLVLEHSNVYWLDDVAAARSDLNGDLLCLTTINIRFNINQDDEPVLTLARILVKRATVLEYMEVVISIANVTDFIRIREELLLYPRLSKKAELVVKSSRVRHL